MNERAEAAPEPVPEPTALEALQAAIDAIGGAADATGSATGANGSAPAAGSSPPREVPVPNPAAAAVALAAPAQLATAIHGALGIYDLPDLVASLGAKVIIEEPANP